MTDGRNRVTTIQYIRTFLRKCRYMYNQPILFANHEIKSNGNQNKGNVFECILCHGYFSQI